MVEMIKFSESELMSEILESEEQEIVEIKLTSRQWALKRFLENNFRSGYYFSIEELVENVRDSEGNQYYKLNTNPRVHDKCVALGSDIKAINWNCNQGYKIIIKNEKGGAKLCESEEELNNWRNAELKKVEKKFQYLNNLKWKAKRDGTMPILNQNLNEVKDLKPVEVYQKEEEDDDELKQYDIWGNEIIK